MHEHLRHARSPDDEACVEAFFKQTMAVSRLMSDFLLRKAKAHMEYQRTCQHITTEAREKLTETCSQNNWQLNGQSPFMSACNAVLSGAEAEALQHDHCAAQLLKTTEDLNRSLEGRQKTIDLLLQQRADLDQQLASVDRELVQLRKANDGAMHALQVARKNVERARGQGSMRAGLQEETAHEFKRIAHNDYLLGIARTNTLRTKLCSFDIAEVLDSLEETHARTVGDFAKLFGQMSDLNTALHQSLLSQHTEIAKALDGHDMQAELSSWLNSFSPTPCAPPDEIVFQPPSTATASTVEARNDNASARSSDMETSSQARSSDPDQRKQQHQQEEEGEGEEEEKQATAGREEDGHDGGAQRQPRGGGDETRESDDDVWLRPEIVIGSNGRSTDDYIKRVTERISGEVCQLASKIGEQSKLLDGAERIHHEYRVNPHFGRADDVLPDVYRYRCEVRDSHTRMQCGHAQLAVLEGVPMKKALRRSVRRSSRRTHRKHTTSPHTAERRHRVHDGGNGQEEHDDYDESSDEDWESDSDGFDDEDDGDDGGVDGTERGDDDDDTRPVECISEMRGPISALVVFDFLGDAKEHLSVQSGDIVALDHCNSHESDWWMATLGGGSGLVPPSYVRPFVGNPRKLARSLYAYQAQGQEQLSFPADELIHITRWNAGGGWTEGERRGERGVFPTSHIERLQPSH